jgi:hypothetical protein
MHDKNSGRRRYPRGPTRIHPKAAQCAADMVVRVSSEGTWEVDGVQGHRSDGREQWSGAGARQAKGGGSAVPRRRDWSPAPEPGGGPLGFGRGSGSLPDVDGIARYREFLEAPWDVGLGRAGGKGRQPHGWGAHDGRPCGWRHGLFNWREACHERARNPSRDAGQTAIAASRVRTGLVPLLRRRALLRPVLGRADRSLSGCAGRISHPRGPLAGGEVGYSRIRHSPLRLSGQHRSRQSRQDYVCLPRPGPPEPTVSALTRRRSATGWEVPRDPYARTPVRS